MRARDPQRRHEREPPADRRLSLLDTNVLIDALRADRRAATVVADAILAGAVASELTRYEILAGMRPEEEEATETLFAQLGWVSVTEEIARLAAALARQFRDRFTGVEDADYVIAASALTLGEQLLTQNVRHFPMLPGLRPAY